MRIAVANVQVPFVHGGAEVHAENLVKQLRARGFATELVTIPFKWYPPERLLESVAIARMLDLTEANGVRIDRLIGLKFPIYLAPHPDKVLWILHQHRTAYELWDHPEHGDLINLPHGQAVRSVVQYADTRFIPEASAIYANSRNVAKRLKRYNGISAKPLYHPPGGEEKLHAGEAEDFLFFPSRIMPLKRQLLVIEALALCRQPVRIVFAGIAEVPTYFARMQDSINRASLGNRVIFKGFTSEMEKINLYARCLGVVYPPVDEDYGYVTLEAMLASKPVITTRDSGGPLEFVEHGRTGLVSEADAVNLAARMDELWADRTVAARMGKAGRDYYDELNISWDHVIKALTA